MPKIWESVVMPWLVEAGLRMCHVPELFYIILCSDALFGTKWPGTCRRAWCESPSHFCGFFSSGTGRRIGRGRPGKMVPIKYVV